ncbi:ecdysteroid 22-kinase family protein [Gordonia bronchialis]|uniref:ecdysteroid 22-kinase family protein n=1 Tax=Gordonia bronchialis TaxID=2054 RepID=UPI001CBE2FCE|nr:ecdysteroid 22-kinase family protein [Gordonia bronchialis]UAK39444.1 ecdysteroid 22-kinase family protein [Gordonia bronchialis]
MNVAVPTSIEELDSEWLTQALQAGLPGVRVTEAEIADSTTGSAARVRLRVSAEGHRDAPSSVMVKAAFTDDLGEDDLSRAWIPLMALMHEAESDWYLNRAAILGDRVPGCFFAAVDGHDAVIVLEDLGLRDGIRYGSFDKTLSRDDMASVLEVLASLHAHRWADPRLATSPLRDSFEVGGMLDGFLSRANWDQQAIRPRFERMPRELNDFDRCTGAIRTAWGLKRQGPQSLIHGDPHVGNHFFDASGAGLLDWQLQTSGHWASDVVYAIASAMEIEDRREYERDLLSYYLDRVNDLTHGEAPSFDEAWLDYRRFSVWGVASILTPGEGVQSEEYLTVVSERHAQAAVDHESVSLLRAS